MSNKLHHSKLRCIPSGKFVHSFALRSLNKIIPGILEKTWDEIERKIELYKTFFPPQRDPARGGTKEIHVDFIDGKFVQNTTFLDPTPFSKYASELYLEAHLMVEEPINYLDSFSKAGFKRFIGHIEKMSSQEEFVAQGQLLGEVGLALDLQTPIESIKVPFDDLDLVLLMSIHSGFSGQNFEQSVLQKIKELRVKTTIPIEVDGGMNDQTIILAKNAGANIFVSTSFISDSQNPQEQFLKLRLLAG